MGPPFWVNSNDEDENNFYEPKDLSGCLREWWAEPKGIEKVSAPERIRFLERWVARQESIGSAPVGAKHPLLSLCGPDIAAAWGAGTRFLWSWRQFSESVDQLRERAKQNNGGWRIFRGHEERLQHQLWEALRAFEQSHPGIARIDFGQVGSDPVGTARKLASLVELDPTDQQIQSAAKFYKGR